MIQTSPMVTRRLLWCGVVAGPLFTLAYLLEGATRADYNSLRHPVSSLSLGELGWTQMANFLVTGALTFAFALGLRQLLRGRNGSTWGPALVAIMGIGLFGAGIFATDPINGYPPGSPAERLGYSNTAAALHDLFSAFFFFGLVIVCFVFTRYFIKQRKFGWAIHCMVTAFAFLAGFVLSGVGFSGAAGFIEYGGLFQRITLTLGLLWVTLLALYFLRTTPTVAV